MIVNGIYPLVMTVTVCELEHGPVEIVDFPIHSRVDLSIQCEVP